jgi:hypothetical protein
MLLHDFRDVARSNHCYLVDETIIVDSPPSIVLRAIERYVEAREKVLDLIVPMEETGRLGLSGFYASVVVNYEEHSNPSIVGRFDDRLVMRFTLMGEREPFFNGRFTIRPLGTRTELQLKGHFAPPPNLLLRRSSSEIFDLSKASLMIRIFLRELKAVVEAEFETFKDALRPVRTLRSATRASYIL